MRRKTSIPGSIIVLALIIGLFQAVFSWMQKNPWLVVSFIFVVVILVGCYFIIDRKNSRLKQEQQRIDRERKYEEDKLREQQIASQIVYDRMAQIVDESIAIVKTTKNDSTRISRLDVAISTLEEMIKQFPRDDGIREWYKRLRDIRPQMRREVLESVIERYMVRARAVTTLKAKINNAEKALIEVESAYSDTYIDKNAVDHYKQAINQFLTDVQVNNYSEKARKHEFKGQYDKAADAYLDALFHIKNDAVPDELQADQILEIERMANDLRKRAKDEA